MRRTVAGFAASAVILALAGHTVTAHTETDFVAVAAGEQAVIHLKPTHGCDDSPTIEVRIRAPLEDALPGEVDGWTATAEPDGEGRAVLTWTGGELPADETGAFPVEFVVPNTPGELLTFPALQTCANGEELAWIDGDPASEYPVPRLLVLPPCSEPAETLDDVPVDAPGRELLEADLNLLPTTTTEAPTDSAAPTASAAPTDSVETTAPPC